VRSLEATRDIRGAGPPKRLDVSRDTTTTRFQAAAGLERVLADWH